MGTDVVIWFDSADSKPKKPVLPLGTQAGCGGLAGILSSVPPRRSTGNSALQRQLVLQKGWKIFTD